MAATDITRHLRRRSMFTSRPAQARITCGFQVTGMELGRGIPGAPVIGQRPVTPAGTGAQAIVATVHGAGAIGLRPGTARMMFATGGVGPKATVAGSASADIAGKGSFPPRSGRAWPEAGMQGPGKTARRKYGGC